MSLKPLIQFINKWTVRNYIYLSLKKSDKYILFYYIKVFFSKIKKNIHHEKSRKFNFLTHLLNIYVMRIENKLHLFHHIKYHIVHCKL